MPAWWLLPAVAQGVGSAVSYYAKRKALGQQKGFGGSEYERELQRRTKEGIYSPGAKRTIVGKVSRYASQRAAEGKQMVSGQMQRLGLGETMIGTSAMRDYDTEVANRIAETTREIELANEASKVQARERYAMERYKDRIRKGRIAGERTLATGELAGGLLGAVGTGYQASRTLADMFGGKKNMPEDYIPFANVRKLDVPTVQSMIGYGGIGKLSQPILEMLMKNSTPEELLGIAEKYPMYKDMIELELANRP